MTTRIILAFLLAGFSTSAAAQMLVESAERDQVVSIEHDSPEMTEAFRKGRSTLGAFFDLAENPREGMDTFSVKIGIPTRRGHEYIWIGNFRRANGLVTGRIDNTPRWTKKISEGQVITFRETRIVDWLYVDGDRTKGNFTACAMNKMSSAAEAEAMVERFKLTCED